MNPANKDLTLCIYYNNKYNIYLEFVYFYTLAF